MILICLAVHLYTHKKKLNDLYGSVCRIRIPLEKEEVNSTSFADSHNNSFHFISISINKFSIKCFDWKISSVHLHIFTTILLDVPWLTLWVLQIAYFNLNIEWIITYCWDRDSVVQIYLWFRLALVGICQAVVLQLQKILRLPRQ